MFLSVKGLCAMQDVDDFLRECKPAKTGKQSVLMPYLDEILELKNRGYSERVVLDFLLQKKGVTISQQSLNRFIRSQIAKNTASAAESAPTTEQLHSKVENEKIVINQQNIEKPAKPNEPTRSEAPRAERAGIRRWPSADEVDLSKLY